jgi:hypothetical protein
VRDARATVALEVTARPEGNQTEENQTEENQTEGNQTEKLF